MRLMLLFLCTVAEVPNYEPLRANFATMGGCWSNLRCMDTELTDDKHLRDLAALLGRDGG